jgi:polyketide biosynthesis enoyl-CoA hydratase PksI
MTTATIVDVQEAGPGIVTVTMQDRARKNLFSTELFDALIAAFTSISRRPDCKVVLLTGYDSYFLSGGDRQGLLAIHEARAKCTDDNFFRLLLDCPVPVISAMQGHGIGGGFVFGLYADFVVLSRESVYTTNFMNYGITPGMGGTCIVPRKLGTALGEEMLLAARSYRGGELEKRGVGFPVVPRAELLDYARQLAADIAAKPRASLVMLKEHLTRELREQLPHTVERELAMHDLTFHQPEVRERIEEVFAGAGS